MKLRKAVLERFCNNSKEYLEYLTENQQKIIFHLNLKLGQKQKSCFRKSAGCIVKCVSEYPLLISKTSNKQTEKKQESKIEKETKEENRISPEN